MAGYITTPLIKKLGINKEMKIMLLNEPKYYTKILNYDLHKQRTNKSEEADFVHVFVTSKEELTRIFLQIISEAKDSLIVWISWY